MHYTFTSQGGNALLTLRPTNDTERALVDILGHGKAYLSQPDDGTLVIGFETLFSDDSEREQSNELSYGQICDALYTQPAPEPTEPAAPDPGPGWRFFESQTVKIPSDAQFYDFKSGLWIPTVAAGALNRCGYVYRTPIYHNPANLESAGEGYRFCLVSETRRDATHFWDAPDKWVKIYNPNDEVLDRVTTYRTNKPLPTT